MPLRMNRAYTLRAFGKTYPLEPKLAGRLLWAFAAWIALGFCYTIYMLVLAAEMLAYHSGVAGFWCGTLLLVLFAEVEVNSWRISLLPSYVSKVLRAGLVFATTHYLYTVEHWSPAALVALLLPSILMLLLRLAGIRAQASPGSAGDVK